MANARLWAGGGFISVAVLLVGLSSRVVSDDQPKVKLTIPPQAAPVAGRFQMTTAAGQLYILDTSTGQVWKHNPDGKTDASFFESKIKKDADWSGSIGPTYKSMPLSYWLMLLRDGDEDFQARGIEAIGFFGPKAKAALPDLIDLFVKSLSNSANDPEPIGSAIAAIDPRHEGLQARVKDKDYKVRRDAALAMVAVGMFDPRSKGGRRRAVTLASEETDETPEENNDTPLKWRLPRDKDAIPVLIEILKDREAVTDELSLAVVSLNCLATFKTDAAAAVPEITKLFADKNAILRQYALMALEATAPSANETVLAARMSLKDPVAKVRATGAQVLGQLGDRESVPALKALMKDADPDVRRGVVQAFGRFKEDAELIVPVLLEVLRAPEEIDNHQKINVIHEAYAALKKLGPAAKSAVPELIKQAAKPDSQFSKTAFEVLQKISPDDAKKVVPVEPGKIPPAGVPLPTIRK